MSTMKYLRAQPTASDGGAQGAGCELSRSAGGQADGGAHTSTSSSSHQSPESGVTMVLDVSKPVRSGTMSAT